MAKTLAQMQRELARVETQMAAYPHSRPTRAQRAAAEDAWDEDRATLRQALDAGVRFDQDEMDALRGFAAAWATAAPPDPEPARVFGRFFDVFTVLPDVQVPDRVAEAITQAREHNLDDVPWGEERNRFFREQLHFSDGTVDDLIRYRRFTFGLLHLLGRRQGGPIRKELWVTDGSGWKPNPELAEPAESWMRKLEVVADGLLNVRAWDLCYLKLRD